MFATAIAIVDRVIRKCDIAIRYVRVNGVVTSRAPPRKEESSRHRRQLCDEQCPESVRTRAPTNSRIRTLHAMEDTTFKSQAVLWRGRDNTAGHSMHSVNPLRSPYVPCERTNERTNASVDQWTADECGVRCAVVRTAGHGRHTPPDTNDPGPHDTSLNGRRIIQTRPDRRMCVTYAASAVRRTVAITIAALASATAIGFMASIDWGGSVTHHSAHTQTTTTDLHCLANVCRSNAL